MQMWEDSEGLGSNMNHNWTIYSHTSDSGEPARDCDKCGIHQHGTWYEDHLTNLWLIDWPTTPECKSVLAWDFGHSIGQENWRLN